MSDNPPTLGRRLGWRLETLGYDLVSALVRALPLDAASGLGGAIVGFLGPLTGKHRIVRRNLELAFPEKTPTEREAIAREFWRKIGRTFAEFPVMDRIISTPGRVQVVDLDRLEAMVGGRSPVVLFSGHLSNWETMMAVIARLDRATHAHFEDGVEAAWVARLNRAMTARGQPRTSSRSSAPVMSLQKRFALLKKPDDRGCWLSPQPSANSRISSF